MKKELFFIIVIVLFFSTVYSFGQKDDVFYVANDIEEIQILEIAKDTAIQVYGYDKIKSERPLKARLINDSIWAINGTLWADDATFEEMHFGGTVYIEISKTNKKVLKVTHYK